MPGFANRIPTQLAPTRTFRAALLILWTAALLVLPAVPVSAHAFLDKSDPAANAILPTAPQTITLHFTESLEPSYSKADLFDDTGTQVPGAASSIGADALTMTVAIPPGLRNGTYSLLWRTLSATDGHTAQGYLPFTVGTQADVRIVTLPAPEQSSGTLPDWAVPATRWLSLLGLAALTAIWPVWLWVVRPAVSPVWQLGPKLTRRVRGYTAGVVIFALIASINALLAQAMSVAKPASLLSGLATTITATHYGLWWLARVGLILLDAAVLRVAAWWWPWRRRPTLVLGLILSLLLPLPFSMVSHAGAEPEGQATAIAADYVHVLGASLWVGGLLLLVVSFMPTVRELTAAGRRVVLGRALPRFSLLALLAWGMLGLTGLYAAWLQVGNLPALTETAYGKALIVKLALIVPLLGLGAFNLLVVTRKLRATKSAERVEGWSRHFLAALTAEAVIVTLLLAVVGVLIGTPPARQVMEQEAGERLIALAAGGQSASLILMPGTVGQNHYRLDLGDGPLRDAAGAAATLRIELPARQTGQIDVPLRAAPGGFEAHGAELAFPGDWNLQVTVHSPGQPDWVVSTTESISAQPPPSQAPDPPPFFGLVGIAALLLFALGAAGIVFAAIGSRPVFRKEAFGLGTAAIALGAVFLFQAQLPAPTAAATDPAALLAALDPAAVIRGDALFAKNCAVCHGPGGHGDGPGGKNLTPPPADLTAGHALMHADDSYAFWIAHGIQGTGMPAFGDTLNEGQIRDVIAYLRSLQLPTLQARDAPGPEACVVTPRTLDEIKALAQQPTPLQTPAAAEGPGVPADSTTKAEITAAAREMVACSNSGDILRRLALYSNARLHLAYPDGPTRALEAIAKTPLPLSLPERVALLSVGDIRQLADGRISARMVVENPANHSDDPNVVVSQQEAATLIFVREDGQWRIDETQRQDTSPSGTPPVSTPPVGTPSTAAASS
jgi:copper transport protein